MSSFFAVQKDSWVGVQNLRQERMQDASDFEHPLQSIEITSKSYANGKPFDEKTDFNFGLDPSWEGPCVYLKLSEDASPLETKDCHVSKGYICEWNGI